MKGANTFRFPPEGVAIVLLVHVVLLTVIAYGLLLRARKVETEVFRLQSELAVVKEKASKCSKMEAYCREHAPFTQLTYWCEEPRVKNGEEGK